MKNRILLLIILVFNSYFIFSQSDYYYNNKLHYSLLIPKDWRQISKNEIDSQMRKLHELTGSKFIDFETGFQPKELDLNQNPYLLIQHFNFSVTWQEFLSIFGNKFEYNDFDDSHKLFINQFNSKDPIVNREKNMVILNMETDVEFLGELRTISVSILGKIGFAQFLITISKKDFEKYLPDITQIINSIAFDENYKYISKLNEQKKDDNTAYKEELNESLNKNIKKMTNNIIGFFVFLLALLIISKLIKYFKNKN